MYNILPIMENLFQAKKCKVLAGFVILLFSALAARSQSLTVADVQTIIAQAVSEAVGAVPATDFTKVMAFAPVKPSAEISSLSAPEKNFTTLSWAMKVESVAAAILTVTTSVAAPPRMQSSSMPKHRLRSTNPGQQQFR